MLLTSLAIQNARPREKPYKLSDGDGLHLLVLPSGKTLWRFRYRFVGKENMLALGTFPTVSLANARDKREAARKLIANGIDPANQRRQDKLTVAIAARNTFAALVEEHLTTLQDSGAASSTISKNRWLLQDLAAPLAKRPIAEITPAEILVILKKIELSGRRETARRLRGALGTIFRLAIATLRATNDPTFALRRALAPPVVAHRPAIIDETQLGALMLSIDEHDGWPTVRAALQLVALTMTRPGEVRHMRRSEIVWPKAMWRIPAERMKMRQPHDVPLSRQALAILRELWPLSDGSDLVLPSVRSAVKPLSENAMNSALRRMGYGKDEMCPHGFRSAASTILNERGHDRDVIEAALAHQDEDHTRAAYTRFTFDEALDTGKIVIINNSKEKLGDQGAEFFGRFFIAQLLATAQRRSGRPQHEKRPVLCYIDECQNVVSRDEKIPTILDECRSQRIALILAHQRTAQITDDNVLSALQNCAIRFANSDAEARKLAHSLRTSEQFLEGLDRGEFAAYIRDHTRTAIAVGVVKPDFSAEEQFSPVEWEQLRDRMMKDYGRIADKQPPMRDSPTEPDGRVPAQEPTRPNKGKSGRKAKLSSRSQPATPRDSPVEQPSSGPAGDNANDPGEPSDTW